MEKKRERTKHGKKKTNSIIFTIAGKE